MSIARIIKLERDIKGRMIAISNKTKTPAEAGVGKLMSSLKSLDEVAHDKLMQEYKQLLIKIKNE